MTEWKDVLDILQKLTATLAIGGAAAWALYHHWRGRTYRPRLEPEVSGQFLRSGGLKYLLCAMRLKNVGRSVVEINGKGEEASLIVHTHRRKPPPPPTLRSAVWKRLTSFPAFECEKWIEPGKAIGDRRLIVLPADEPFALKVVLHVVTERVSWKATAIVTPASETSGGKATGEKEHECRA